MPAKYTPSEQHFDAAYRLAKKGCSHREIAAALEISYSTFRRNIEHFRSHLKKGYDETDESRIEAAENAFFKRVIGYTYEEETIEKKVVDGKETVSKKVVKKHVLPDVTAGIFWLVNRSHGRWKSINNPQEPLGADAADLTAIAEALDRIDSAANGVPK